MAVKAVARADIPENQEGRCSIPETLRDVGTACLLTDGMEAVLPEHTLNLFVRITAGEPDLQPVRFT
jgi:hypothetical protein